MEGFIEPAQFDDLLASGQALLDVRSESEYQRSSFPNSHLAPILNDDERHRVGLTYKREGQSAAVALGHQLVHGEIKDRRVRIWKAITKEHDWCGALLLTWGHALGDRSKLAR